MIPFTDHVTLGLVAPVNMAAKVCDAPARTSALVGVTLMEIWGGGVVGGGVFCLPGAVPAQPASTTSSSKAREKNVFLKGSPIVVTTASAAMRRIVHAIMSLRCAGNNWTKVQVKATGGAVSSAAPSQHSSTMAEISNRVPHRFETQCDDLPRLPHKF